MVSCQEPNIPYRFSWPNSPFHCGPTSEGWVCPKCGAVFAPIFFECKYCNKHLKPLNEPAKEAHKEKT